MAGRFTKLGDIGIICRPQNTTSILRDCRVRIHSRGTHHFRQLQLALVARVIFAGPRRRHFQSLCKSAIPQLDHGLLESLPSGSRIHNSCQLRPRNGVVIGLHDPKQRQQRMCIHFHVPGDERPLGDTTLRAPGQASDMLRRVAPKKNFFLVILAIIAVSSVLSARSRDGETIEMAIRLTGGALMTGSCHGKTSIVVWAILDPGAVFRGRDS
ncbi:hypothetical protein IWX48DRAFT_621128 [Phyllosticta citricarpa]